jgi:hypothetical protein
MTKIVRVLVLASLVFGTALFATAQSAVRVAVPFDFQIAGRTLPAGTYTVSRVFERDPNFFVVNGVSNTVRASILALGSTDQSGAGLSFRRYGNAYFLRAISTPSGRFALAQSKAERQAAASESPMDVSVGSR